MAEWTAERDAQLRQWRREGFSLELIARKFNALGFAISRGSVAGRAFRQGLGYLPKKVLRPPAPLPGQQVGPVVKRSTNAALATGFLGIALIDLDQNQCRFPQGEGPILFCGQPARADSSYCEKHHEICCGP